MKGNLFPNLTTIGIMAVSMLIFSTFTLLAFNLTNLLKTWEDKIEVIAYLKRGVAPGEVEPLLKKTRLLEGVETVRYISPYDAMTFMEMKLGGQKNLLEGIQPAVLQKLRDAFAKAGTDPKFQKFLQDNNMPYTPMDGEEYTRYLKQNYDARAPLLRELGMASRNKAHLVWDEQEKDRIKVYPFKRNRVSEKYKAYQFPLYAEESLARCLAAFIHAVEGKMPEEVKPCLLDANAYCLLTGLAVHESGITGKVIDLPNTLTLLSFVSPLLRCDQIVSYGIRESCGFSDAKSHAPYP
jgi:hypothetical protein